MKNTLHRVVSGALAIGLALVLAACGGGNDGGSSAGSIRVNKNKAVIDNADVLSEDTENYVTNLSVALQESCGAQIGVYTVEYIGNTTMEGYCYEVASAWELGDAEKDNGLVLLLATGDDDYFLMRGAGLESQLSVTTLQDLLNSNLEPSWVNKDYDTGTRATVRALTERLCRLYGVTMDIDAVATGQAGGKPVKDSQPESSGGGFPFLTVLLIIGAIVLVLWLLGNAGRSRRRTPPPPPGAGMGGYTAPPRRQSSFGSGFASGVGFGIGQNIGRRMFGGSRRTPPPPPPPRPPVDRPPAGPRPGGMPPTGSFSAPRGGFSQPRRSSGSGMFGGVGRSGGGSVRRSGGNFRSGGGSFRGGGAGRGKH